MLISGSGAGCGAQTIMALDLAGKQKSRVAFALQPISGGLPANSGSDLSQLRYHALALCVKCDLLVDPLAETLSLEREKTLRGGSFIGGKPHANRNATNSTTTGEPSK